MRVLSLAAAVVATSAAAFAHDTAIPHVHPHGADLLVMALALAALAVGGYKAGLFTLAKQDSRDRK